jgi:hypothetical protein
MFLTLLDGKVPIISPVRLSVGVFTQTFLPVTDSITVLKYHTIKRMILNEVYEVEYRYFNLINIKH